ncbi:MAG TPA: hypothetical protein VKU84_01800 [Stellaceae bacterium]|nr:hypothetical protein [Stellaceae bacterium]
MSLSSQLPYGTTSRRRDPIDPAPSDTAVQVIAAWLIAFTCLALMGLLS